MSMLCKKSELIPGFILSGTLFRVFLGDLCVLTPFLLLGEQNL
jgi:hypothetical protein